MERVTQGTIIRQMTTGGFRITETLHAPRLTLRPHDHDNANINMVLDGRLEERVETRTYACLPGSMLLKPAGARHDNQYGDRPTRCLILEVGDQGPTRQLVPAAVLFRPAVGRVAAYLLQRELSQPDAATPLIVEGLALQVIGLMTREDSRTERHLPPWLHHAREMLEASLREPCTLAQIAAAVGIDRTHLSKTFRRHFRLSPGAYLRRQRILKAASLLRAGATAMSDVAAACGFADQSHFCKVFRAQMRVSPGQYRRLWTPKHAKTPQSSKTPPPESS